MISLAKAECWHCIHFEMALYLSDFFNRRTGMLFFDIERITSLVEPISLVFKESLEWSDKELAIELQNLERSLQQATGFKRLS
jgi:glycerol-3-phosphate dehydrogenase